jgi:hypothetical protein
MAEARKLVECEIGFRRFGPESPIFPEKPKTVSLPRKWKVPYRYPARKTPKALFYRHMLTYGYHIN